jgi:hypothetical protein
MQSTAATVDQYLAELPSDRRAAVEAVRTVVRANIDPIVEEGMTWGMIGWSIPHSVYPGGYHTKPSAGVPYACLASQKNYMSLYLPINYSGRKLDEQWFRREWAKTGKKLDMGRSCVRFARVEDLALDVIAASMRKFPASEYVKIYAAIDPRNASGKAAKAARTSKKAKVVPAARTKVAPKRKKVAAKKK